MDIFMSRLMSDHAVTDLVIIRDDALITEHQRADFNALHKTKDKTRQRPSFRNSSVKNCAPTLPARKESIDDLSLSLRRKSCNRRKRTSFDDEMLSMGMKNISRHHQALPRLLENTGGGGGGGGGSNGPSPRHNMLFGDIFRDVDEILKVPLYD